MIIVYVSFSAKQRYIHNHFKQVNTSQMDVFDRFFWILTGTTTPGLHAPGINDNRGGTPNIVCSLA